VALGVGAGVVIVQSVGHGAVGQGRQGCRGAKETSDNGSPWPGAERRHEPGDGLADRVGRAGERNPDGVQKGAARGGTTCGGILSRLVSTTNRRSSQWPTSDDSLGARAQAPVMTDKAPG